MEEDLADSQRAIISASRQRGALATRTLFLIVTTYRSPSPVCRKTTSSGEQIMWRIPIPDYAHAWLAFRELHEDGLAFLANSPRQWKNAGKAGWFDHLGLFSSSQKRFDERVLSIPHDFRVAFDRFGSDIYFQQAMVPPEQLVRLLADRRGTEPSHSFAEREIATAIAQLCMETGTGALREGNDTEAVKWLHRASDQGNADAQLTLGCMYAEGKRVPRDHVSAHKWLNLAAASLAGRSREEAAKHRDRISEVMTAAERREAEALARQWAPQSWDEQRAQDPSMDSVW
jgi:hypothetical protein